MYDTLWKMLRKIVISLWFTIYWHKSRNSASYADGMQSSLNYSRDDEGLNMRSGENQASFHLFTSDLVTSCAGSEKSLPIFDTAVRARRSLSKMGWRRLSLHPALHATIALPKVYLCSLKFSLHKSSL